MLRRTLVSAGRRLIQLYLRRALELDVQLQAALPAGPAIIAANHPSTLDPLALIGLPAAEPSVLISESVFRVPLVGRYLRAAGHIPVLAGAGPAALRAAEAALAAGRSVAIFPEGAISPLDGRFHRPRSGLARLALSSGAPVVPVGIALERERLRLTELRIGATREVATWYLRGPYALSVGAPLRFTGDPQDRALVAAVSAAVMGQIVQLAGQSAYRLHGAGGATPPALPALRRGEGERF